MYQKRAGVYIMQNNNDQNAQYIPLQTSADTKKNLTGLNHAQQNFCKFILLALYSVQKVKRFSIQKLLL